MGWFGWIIDKATGVSTNTKVEHGSDGSKVTHHLTTAGGGSRSNHSHVVVKERSDGRKVAHCYPQKNKRS